MFNLAQRWGVWSGENPTRHVERYRERKVDRFLSDAELARLGAVLTEAERASDDPAAVEATAALRLAGCPRRTLLTLRWRNIDLKRRRVSLTEDKTLMLDRPTTDRLARLPRAGDDTFVLPCPREHASVIAALRLLVLTGCRRNEVLTLRWNHVDLAHSCLRLPDSKTGAKVVALGASALALLAALPQQKDNPYVFPGEKKGNHYVALELAWRRIRLRAELTDVRLHDLRHSFASAGAGAGESLVILGGLLGHSSADMTKRYAHLSNDPLKAAADRIAGRQAAMMAPRVADGAKLDRTHQQT